MKLKLLAVAFLSIFLLSQCDRKCLDDDSVEFVFFTLVDSDDNFLIGEDKMYHQDSVVICDTSGTAMDFGGPRIRTTHDLGEGKFKDTTYFYLLPVPFLEGISEYYIKLGPGEVDTVRIQRVEEELECSTRTIVGNIRVNKNNATPKVYGHHYYLTK